MLKIKIHNHVLFKSYYRTCTRCTLLHLYCCFHQSITLLDVANEYQQFVKAAKKFIRHQFKIYSNSTAFYQSTTEKTLSRVELGAGRYYPTLIIPTCCSPAQFNMNIILMQSCQLIVVQSFLWLRILYNLK